MWIDDGNKHALGRMSTHSADYVHIDEDVSTDLRRWNDILPELYDGVLQYAACYLYELHHRKLHLDNPLDGLEHFNSNADADRDANANVDFSIHNHKRGINTDNC